MEWCNHCHRYYESTTSGACPNCGRKVVIDTTDRTPDEKKTAAEFDLYDSVDTGVL